MAGKTVTEAQEAQRASKRSSPQATATPAKSFVAITGLDGKLWYVNPSQLGQLPSPPETAAFARVANPPGQISDYSTECWEHVGFMAHEDTMAAVDWSTHVKEITDSVLADIVLINQQGQSSIASLTATPFLLDLDLGATVHILPYQEDFVTLRSISPRTVKGLGGLSVAAIGIGNICLHIAKGANIVLTDALYIPNATI